MDNGPWNEPAQVAQGNGADGKYLGIVRRLLNMVPKGQDDAQNGHANSRKTNQKQLPVKTHWIWNGDQGPILPQGSSWRLA